MKNQRQTLCRKIQLIPVGDKEETNRVYTYLRDGMESQNRAMNEYMSTLYVSNFMELDKDDRKELRQLFSRVSDSKLGSGFDNSINLPKGLPMGGTIERAVKSDFDKAMKEGLKYGRVSLPTYRKDNPLLVHIDYVRLRSTNPHNDFGLYHGYENYTDFLDKLYSERDLDLFIKFANKITFKVFLGNPHKSQFLRSEIQKIFEEEYIIQGSSIQISNKKIILNLSMSIPVIEKELDEGTVVGVDVGIINPAYVALNNNTYIRKHIGSKESFIGQKTKIQNQKSRLQRQLKAAKGGHGRAKKVKAIDRIRNHEANWVKNYNHYISKEIISFAIQNNAKYINLEKLSGIADGEKKGTILGKWSYYQLQQFIEYKAKKYGIEVRYVNPAYTSQACSCCGNLEEGQRITQSKFICKKCGTEINADFNAARNIAMSTDFVK